MGGPESDQATPWLACVVPNDEDMQRGQTDIVLGLVVVDRGTEVPLVVDLWTECGVVGTGRAPRQGNA